MGRLVAWTKTFVSDSYPHASVSFISHLLHGGQALLKGECPEVVCLGLMFWGPRFSDFSWNLCIWYWVSCIIGYEWPGHPTNIHKHTQIHMHIQIHIMILCLAIFAVLLKMFNLHNWLGWLWTCVLCFFSWYYGDFCLKQPAEFDICILCDESVVGVDEHTHPFCSNCFFENQVQD